MDYLLEGVMFRALVSSDIRESSFSVIISNCNAVSQYLHFFCILDMLYSCYGECGRCFCFFVFTILEDIFSSVFINFSRLLSEEVKK